MSETTGESDNMAELVDQPSQEELPFAYVAGRAITELPKDLYIPPDALEIFLEAFEGPLDLLLYLIKRQNIDILEINVSDITEQYMAYVDLMEASQFELAAEYLVMAATLAEIKSRILLPRQQEDEEEEEDPRTQLIRRLQEYERFKKAAEDIEELPRIERDLYQASGALPEIERVVPDPDVDLCRRWPQFCVVVRCSSTIMSSARLYPLGKKCLRYWPGFPIKNLCRWSLCCCGRKGVWESW